MSDLIKISEKNAFSRKHKVTTVLLCVVCMMFYMASSGCRKQGDDDLSKIHGKWKLVEIFVPFSIERYYDYSQDDIVYEFHTNGILTISGETYPIDRWRGFEEGDYAYSFVDKREAEEKVGFAANRLKIVTKISELYFPYNVNSEELTFGTSILDGKVYKLAKINNNNNNNNNKNNK